MALHRKKIGRVLAKALGIDLRRDEPKHDDYALSNPIVEPFYEINPTTEEFLSKVYPTKAGFAQYFRSLFPFVNWIFHYNLQWLMGDVVAGLTVGFVAIPQGMAYASLARLTPEYGLYTSFVGFLLYWAFATSKDITIGTVAIMSTIVGNVVIRVQDQHPDIPAEQIARGLALICGAILLFIGLTRLGWIVEFIPLVAIASFTTGAALSIAAGQVPAMMGITGINTREPTHLIVIETLKNLGRAKVDAAMGITAMVLLYFLRWVCNFLARKQPQRKKLWFFVSTLRMAFVFLFYTMISWLVNRNIQTPEDAKFKILGTVPRGFQHAGAPRLDTRLIKAFASDIPATLIVLIIEHIAISKSFGRINNYTINPSQELVALGFTNLFGPFLGGFPATGSFSRTAIKSKAGVRTPLAGIFTAILVLLALYALTSVFFYIPSASLSGLIIHAVLDVVTPPNVVYGFWAVSPCEVFIFFAGVLITVFTTIENGIYVAIAASAALLLFRHARAKGISLGRVHIHYFTKTGIHNTTDRINNGLADPDVVSSVKSEAYIPICHLDGSNPSIAARSPYPGIFVYKFTDGFSYVNQARYLDSLIHTVLTQTRPTRLHDYKRAGDRPWNDPGPRRGQQIDLASDPRPILRAVVLDFTAVPHVDVTSVQGLVDARNQLDRHAAPEPVEWHFAGVGRRWTKRALVAAGFGYPSGGLERAGHRMEGLFSVAEVEDAVHISVANQKRVVELEDGRRIVKASSGEYTPSEKKRDLAAVYGMNRPFFHIDIGAAVQSAVLNIESRGQSDETAA